MHLITLFRIMNPHQRIYNRILLKETAPPQHEHNGTQRFFHYVRMRTQRTIEILCGNNGTMDKRERTSLSVVSACGHNGMIKFVCGHNGTADTMGRNRRFFIFYIFLMELLNEIQQEP